MRFMLVRHGESSSNLMTEVIAGKDIYTKLTDRGKAQARQFGHWLDREVGQHKLLVFTSPAARAMQTAILASVDGMSSYSKEVVVDEALLELDMGDWEGRVKKSCYTPSVLKKLDSYGVDFESPNGESVRRAAQRLKLWLQRTSKLNEDKANTVVAYTHSMLIRSFVGMEQNWSHKDIYKTSLENLSITEVVVNGQSFSITAVGRKVVS